MANLTFHKHNITIKLVEVYLQNKNSAIWLALDLVDNLFNKLFELDPKDPNYYYIFKLLIESTKNTNYNEDGFDEFPELNYFLDQLEEELLEPVN